MGWLLLVSAIAAAFVVLIFERLSDRVAGKKALRQLWANLFSFWLFSGNPRVVMQSMGGLITANCRLLLSVLIPMIITFLLFFFSYGYLDNFFGSVPLSIGVPRVLTVRLAVSNGEWPDVALQTPDWILVDAPPVHDFDNQEISWRIRAARADRGLVKIVAGSETVQKVIDSRPGLRYFSPALMNSWWSCLRYPAESCLPAGIVSQVNLFGPIKPYREPLAADWIWRFSFWTFLFALLLRWVVPKRQPIN